MPRYKVQKGRIAVPRGVVVEMSEKQSMRYGSRLQLIEGGGSSQGSGSELQTQPAKRKQPSKGGKKSAPQNPENETPASEAMNEDAFES